MRGTRRYVVLMLLLVAAGAARANETRGAKDHYEKGTALYDLGQYREAAKEYEEAFKLKPVPALLFNIAQAYRLAGDETAALRAYRGYLRREPQAANRAEVEGYMTRLEQALQEKRRATAPSVPETRPAPETTGAAPTVTTAPPPPATTTAPPLTAATTTTTTASPTRAPERQPAYKKWWVWTIVGGVVAAGVGVGLGLALTQPKDVTIPGDAHTVRF